jgi:hypothetical protein
MQKVSIIAAIEITQINSFNRIAPKMHLELLQISQTTQTIYDI